MKQKLIFLVICCGLIAAGGCATKAEKRFVAADARVIGMYVEKAQPVIELYCEALEEAGQYDRAIQLRVDTRALAAEMHANAKLRLEKLRSDEQAVKAARTALALAGAVLETFEKATFEKPTEEVNDRGELDPPND